MATRHASREKNLTLRVDSDVLLWAGVRARFGGTSVNKLIRGFLAEYAAVPDRWRQGLPPPWTPDGRIHLVMDAAGAGERAPGADPATTEALEAISEAARARQG